MPDYVVRVPSWERFEELERQPDMLKLLCFLGLDTEVETPPLLRALSSVFRGRALVLEVRVHEAAPSVGEELAARYGVSALPSVVGLRPSGELFSELVDVAWREDLIYSAVDEGKVDTERFPRFADAPRMQHTLSPGECVLIPAYWWHNLVSPAAEPNLALSFFFPNALRPRVDYGAIYRWIGSVRDEVMPYLYWHREAKTHAARSAADVRAGGLHVLGEAERAYAEEAAAAVQAGHQKLVELERTCPLVSEPSNRAAKPKSEL